MTDNSWYAEVAGFEKQARECTDPAKLADLAKSIYYTVRQDVAQNPHTSLETLLELAEDHNKHVRAGLASNPKLPPEVIHTLSVGKLATEQSRIAAGSNPSTAEATLWHLAGSSVAAIRRAVGRNPNATTRILERLALRARYQTVVDIAEHPNVNENTLLRLYKSLYITDEAAANIAANPLLSAPSLKKIIEEDLREPVTLAAGKNPNANWDLACQAAWRSRYGARFSQMSDYLAETALMHKEASSQAGAQVLAQSVIIYATRTNNLNGAVSSAREVLDAWKKLTAWQKSLALELWNPELTPLEVINLAADVLDQDSGTAKIRISSSRIAKGMAKGHRR